MKRLFVAMSVTLLSVALLSGVATATSTNKTTVIHYNVSYTDPIAGPVNCIGVHQTGKNFPGTAIAGGQDSFTCTSTTGSALTNVTPGQVITLGVGDWCSDYYYFVLNTFVCNTIAFSVTVSADGFSYSGVVGYY